MTNCLSVDELASELTNCLSFDEFASELTNCLSVDEFASELTNCLSLEEYDSSPSILGPASTDRLYHTAESRRTSIALTPHRLEIETIMASSTRRADILSLIHIRSDGRRPHEIRHMSCHLGALPSTACGSALPTSACSGSALVSMGLTQVLCTVRGPCDIGRRSDELSDRYEYNNTCICC